MFPSSKQAAKSEFVNQTSSSSLLEIEVKLPPVNRAVAQVKRIGDFISKSTPAQAISLSEVFFGEGITRFNSVLGGAAFISVSLGIDGASEPSKEASHSQPNTFVRLWSVPDGELRLDRRHQVEPNSPCMSDQLIFSAKNVVVTQSPEASLISVTSDNMIGVYEIRLKGTVPFFKWNSSYLLPDECLASKATFHVGSEALAIKTNKGDIDWVEIKNGAIGKLFPQSSDKIKIGEPRQEISLAA